MPKSLGGLGKIDEYNLMVSKNCNTPIPRRRGWNLFGFVAYDATACMTAATISVIGNGGATAIPNPLFGGVPTAGAIGVVAGAGGSISYTIGKFF